MSHALLLELPDNLFESLAHIARKEGVSLESVSLQWLANTAQRIASDPLEEFIGAFKSDFPDLGENHDKYLADILHDEMTASNNG